ncbi:hypothetical protein HMPREF9413_3009 [Paenibacillus sp. HGF7]|nr:hypothetical protein HMPREF9413_3009 [Paenibacillus sp. HGF7]
MKSSVCVDKIRIQKATLLFSVVGSEPSFRSGSGLLFVYFKSLQRRKYCTYAELLGDAGGMSSRKSYRFYQIGTILRGIVRFPRVLR